MITDFPSSMLQSSNFSLNCNSMVPLVSFHTPNFSTIKPFFLFSPSLPFTRLNKLHLQRSNFPRKNSTFDNPFRQQYDPESQKSQEPPRTVFPGGFKRPEIKVPSLLLELEPEEVLSGGDALDLIDNAVSKYVGLVVLNGSEGSGGKVYEAARLLKSVIKDRAYFLIAERVDIAAAVGASGVLLSDQGLPAIVARNTMLSSKPESVVLPLVARKVQNANAALSAANSEGADFLVYDVGKEKFADESIKPVFRNVKTPIFIIDSSREGAASFLVAPEPLKTGASGFVVSLGDLRLRSDALSKLLDTLRATNKKSQDEVRSFNILKRLGIDHDLYQRNGVGGFTKLEDREKELIETERSVLLEAVNVIKKAAPLVIF